MKLTSQVYAGSYTNTTANPIESDKGIFLLELDLDNGNLRYQSGFGGAVNPSFLAFSHNQKILYCVNETQVFNDQIGGGVSAFLITPDGLSLINQQPTFGKDPCHLILTPDGSLLLVSNYSSGSLSVFPIYETGSIEPLTQLIEHSGHGPHLTRQEGPHVHSVSVDPTLSWFITADLGNDQLSLYQVDKSEKKLFPNPTTHFNMPPGSGPRHMTWRSSQYGYTLYVINELSSTISILSFDPRSGELTTLQSEITTLPSDFHGENTAADIHISGNYLYASNRGHDSLAIFTFEDNQGRLSPVGHVPSGGSCPRNFAIHPDGRWLLTANQTSESIQVFALEPTTGALYPGEKIQIPSPVCLIFK